MEPGPPSVTGAANPPLPPEGNSCRVLESKFTRARSSKPGDPSPMGPVAIATGESAAPAVREGAAVNVPFPFPRRMAAPPA